MKRQPAKSASHGAHAHAESSGRKRRILIVDDHPLFRHGIGDLINAEADLEVCGEADNAPSALDSIRSLAPDLVTIDISLRGANGIELLKSIKAEHPKLPLLVLSMHDENLYALRALRAGARGYIMKQEALDRVMSAIRQVLQGELYVSPSMSGRMIEEFVQGGSGNTSGSIADKLTDRELEILQLIGQGHGVQQIARELNLSAKTVETHRAHVKEKLNFQTARELARFAVQWVDQQIV
ncbi:MAG: response regulator transcription factor [Chthoniobacteraceae bacterium]|jgi:DNA-binding NarL/FixJ family response regulator